MKLPDLLSVVFTLLLCARANGQHEAYIRYTSSDGLPGNVLYAVCEDNRGYIWIGGASGLSRFDGTHFRNYSIRDGIPDNEVLKLEKDRQGRIWMLGFNGNISFIENGRIMGIRQLPLLRKAKLKGVPCFFYQTPQNDIEITDETGYVVVLRFAHNRLIAITAVHRGALFSICSGSKRIALFYHQWVNGTDTLPYRFINNSPVIACKQAILVGSDREITSFSAAGMKRLFAISPDQKITHLFTDNASRLWYADASDQTVNCCDLSKNRGRPAISYHFPYPFTYFMIDSRGNRWICSRDQGLFLYPRNWSSYRHSHSAHPITALFYTPGGLLTGTTSSEICLLDPQSLHLRQRVRPDAGIYQPVKGIKASCSGMICAYGYFRSSMALLPFTPPGLLKLINAKDISFDCNGIMLVSSASTLCRIQERALRTGTVLNTRRNYAVCFVAPNEYWYSDIAGLHSVKGVTDRLIRKHGPLFSNRISRIERLSDGCLFLLTDGIGCSVFDRETREPIGPVYTFPEVTDFRNVLISRDTIWLATNKGILVLKYSRSSFQLVKRIGLSDGLLSDDVLAVACSEHTLYASTPEGLSKLDKAALLTALPPPALSVVSISADGVSSRGNRCFLDHSPKTVKLFLGALHFGSRAPLEFSYSLNAGNDWTTSRTPVIELRNLPEGATTVLIRARKTAGKWSAVEQVRITVPIPVYHLLWVRLLAALGIAGIIVWLTVSITGKIRKKQLATKDAQLAVTDLELRSLRSMMNTHFIFNALNSIQQFITGRDHREANLYLGRFSHLMRNHLNASLDASVSLAEELQSLEHYLALERLRLEERLQYAFLLPDPLPDISVPGFILQPLVENAIWHGLMPLEHGGTVEIEVTANSSELVVRIRDTGVGLQANHPGNQHSSRGIRMIRKRLEILSGRTGRKHELHLLNRKDVEPGNPGGAVAIVTIALR